MAKQLSIFAENKRGAMNALTRILKDNEINISALVTNDSAEYGIVRLIVDKADTAIDVLKQAGYQCHLDKVIAIVMEDTPGYLDGITGEYSTPKGYFVDEQAAELFDTQFPKKEKLRLPGQIF